MTMPQDRLDQLKALAPAVLADVVRQDQRNPDFAITSWTVERLSDKGIANPDALFRFYGRGRLGDVERPWSVVLKVLTDRADEAPLSDVGYWKRELLLAQSGLLANLPGPVTVPRFYKVSEQDGFGWIWMEHVQATSGQPWTPNEYAFAARQLGQSNGAYLVGTPLPDAPWLHKDHYRSWVARCRPGIDIGWEDPQFRRQFSSAVQTRYLALLDECERFCSALDRLPQVLSHFDLGRRNLFVHEGQNHRQELVVIDWAMCGHGPVGGDLCGLVGLSAVHLEYEPATAPHVAAAVVEAYLAGLRDAGWTGDPDLARLGYTAGLAMHLGACFPILVPWFIIEERRPFALRQFGVAGEELLQKWVPLFLYVLDCADEALRLMARLNK